MITKRTEYNYETPYMGPFFITQCFTNGTVSLKFVMIEIKYHIRHIKQYNFDTKFEDSSSKNMYDNVNI